MEELQEQLEAGRQAAADAASKAAEAHAVEVQKMVVERTKLEVGAEPGSGLLCLLTGRPPQRMVAYVGYSIHMSPCV